MYNITPYLEFHPGGIPEIMRGAGKDATDLFDEVSFPFIYSLSQPHLELWTYCIIYIIYRFSNIFIIFCHLNHFFIILHTKR